MSRAAPVLACSLLVAAALFLPASPAAPQPPPEKARATLAFGGDVMLARLVTEAILDRGPREVWGDVQPLLQGADLALVNLECVIAEGGEPFQPPRVFYFRAHPKTLEALRVAGIDCVSLANNHAMDYGPGALVECLGRLDAAGIARAGAGRDLAEARKPALLRANGIRIGVYACADHFREYAARPDRPGTNVVEVSVEEEAFRPVREGILATRALGADLVVFSIHWGPNMRTEPTPPFRRFARAVLDAGADVFHGHSAHVVQGIEIYRGKPILYDTGDLLDDYRVDPDLRNDLTLLFLLTVSRTGVERIELVPLRIARMQVNRARGEDLAEVVRRVRRLCRDMGTEVAEEGDRLVVSLAR